MASVDVSVAGGVNTCAAWACVREGAKRACCRASVHARVHAAALRKRSGPCDCERRVRCRAVGEGGCVRWRARAYPYEDQLAR
eukprot:672845-Pleurochrysis_carterae.AAC.3